MSRHLHHARALDLFLSQYVDTGYLFLHDSSGRFALEPTQMIREKTKKHLTMVYFHFKFQYVSINRSSTSSIKPPFHALTKLEEFELGAFGFLLKGWLIVEKHFEGQGLQKNHLQHLWAYCFIYAYHRSGDSGHRMEDCGMAVEFHRILSVQSESRPTRMDASQSFPRCFIFL